MPAKDVTFTAKWTAEGGAPETEYTVTYVIGDGVTGTAPTEADHKAGEKFNLNDAAGLSKDGYVFDKWNDGTKDYDAGAEYTMPESNVTLTAKWKVDAVIGSTDFAVIMHEADETAGEIVLSGDGSGYAYVYNPSTYDTVIETSFDYSIQDDTLTITSWDDSTLKAPATGVIGKRNVSITVQTVGDDSKSYAFSSDIYACAFKYNGAGEDKTQYIPEGYGPFDLTEIEAPANKKLGSIKIDGTAITKEEAAACVMPAKDVEIEYTWTDIVQTEYSITYKPGEGTGNDVVVTTTDSEYSLQRAYQFDSKFSYAGHALAGWTINGTDYSFGARVDLSTLADADNKVTVTAVWKAQYTVSYANVSFNEEDTNYKEGETQVKYTAGAKYSLPYGTKQTGLFGGLLYFTKPGYTLKGWTSSADDGTAQANKVYAPGSNYTLMQDTTFTAVWELISTDYDGYYTTTTALDLTAIGNSSFVAATFFENKLALFAEGEFPETSTEIALSAGVTAGTYTGMLGNMDLTAAFTANDVTITVTRLSTDYTATFIKGELPEYTVTYAAPTDLIISDLTVSGTAPAAQTATYAGKYSVSLQKNTYSLDGWTFKGWQVEGYDIPRAANSSLTVSGNMTLTAVFAKTYTNEWYGDYEFLTNGKARESNGSAYSYPYTYEATDVAGVYGLYLIYNDEPELQYLFKFNGNAIITQDGMQAIGFTAKDGTTELTFDGFGGAMLGTTAATYTYRYDDTVSKSYLSLTVAGTTYDDIELIYDSATETYSINVTITVDSTPYVFGADSVDPEPGPDPEPTVPANVADYVGTYGYSSLSAAGSNTLTYNANASSSYTVYRVELLYNSNFGNYRIKYFYENSSGVERNSQVNVYRDKKDTDPSDADAYIACEQNAENQPLYMNNNTYKKAIVLSKNGDGKLTITFDDTVTFVMQDATPAA